MSEAHTYCPGCDCRIIPGQVVVGVVTDDGSECGSDELWHAGCRKIWEYRAGHAERMKVAQDRVDENLRKHAESVALESIHDGARAKLVARIEAHGGRVHDGNCCENERVDLSGVEDNAGSVSLEGFEHPDDPTLLVLEVVARMLERDGGQFR